MKWRQPWLAVSLTLLSVSACVPKNEQIPVTHVTSQPNCQHVSKGAHVVTYADLARIRGAQLIELTESSADATRPLRLVAISLGEQPSPGYRVVTREVSEGENGTEMTVRVALEEPPFEALRSQSVVNPCLVLGFEGNGALRRVRVERDGELLGAVDLPSESAQ